MRFVRYACVLGLVFLTQTTHAEYRRLNSPHPADAMDAHIYELENGLRVYLTRNAETPRFHAEIAVRTGSKNDPPDATGLAHYLEHLLFKGTSDMGTIDYALEEPHLERITALYEEHFNTTDPQERSGIYAEINRVSQRAAEYAIPNEIDKIYNALGGTHVNAHTWHEETVYQVGLPRNRIEQWTIIESGRFVDPVFRLFHTELEIVYEEKNRSLDNKDRIISEAVDAALFKRHPYGQQTTIGTVEHLKNPRLTYIYDYFNTWYVPNNMAICISGDIDIESTIELIDEHFSHWQRKPLPEIRTWDDPALDGREQVTVQYQGEEFALLAFRTVPVNHGDTEALKVLDMILDNSVAGLINLNLNQQQRVRQAGSFPRFMNDAGVQYLYGIPKEGQSLEDVEALLLEQIGLLKDGAFDDWIIPAIVNDFKKNRKLQLESDQARVGLMRNAFLTHTGWTESVEELDRIAKVTKEDVVRVANAYFDGGYVAGYRVDAQHEVPSIEKPPIDAVDIDPKRRSAFAARVLAMPAEEIEPEFVTPGEDYQTAELASGVELYYAPNPLNDLFVFSMTVEKGTRHDNRIGFATQLLDKAGTERLSAEDLKKEWYKLGTDFGIGAGDNETTVRISGLDENFDQSLSLLVEILNKPAAPPETLEELKAIILVAREDAKKDPGTISRALSLYHRYGAQSSFLQMLPAAEVNELTTDDLFDIVRGLEDYQRTLAYTGSLPLEEVVAALRAHLRLDGGLIKPPEPVLLFAHAPETNQVRFFDKELAQAQVRIEFPNGAYRERDHTAIELYNSYFSGGMSGLVFQELREARALAYSAAARYATGGRRKAENLMIGVIACQADKTPEALEAFIDLIDNLPESQERFDENKAALLSRYRTSRIGFRGVIGAVRAWEDLGLKPDPRRKRFANLEDAGIKAMTAFQKKHLRNEPKLISIVGDSTRIDMDAIRKFGELETVGVETIFVD